MPQPNLTLSVAVITLNEERRIGRCLQSIRFSERVFRNVEMIVVDAESRDHTAAIARQLGAKVFIRPWKGFGDQRNWALQQCTGDWILAIDADEELTPEWIAEIERKLPDMPSHVDGCWTMMRDYYLGKWMRHGGWSTPKLRLIRNHAGYCTTTPVHEGLRVKGGTIQLDSAINHYSYESTRDCLDKADRYSSLTMLALSSRQRRSWKWHLVAAPLFEFFQMYVVRRGILDGWHGFVAAGMSAFHQFLTYVKLWEKEVLMRPENSEEAGAPAP